MCVQVCTRTHHFRIIWGFHICMHRTHRHTYTDTFACTNNNACIQTCTHTYQKKNILIDKHTNVHAYIHTVWEQSGVHTREQRGPAGVWEEYWCRNWRECHGSLSVFVCVCLSVCIYIPVFLCVSHQCVPGCNSVLQCVTVYCNELQCVASVVQLWYSVVYPQQSYLLCFCACVSPVCSSVLQCIAVYCSVL